MGAHSFDIIMFLRRWPPLLRGAVPRSQGAATDARTKERGWPRLAPRERRPLAFGSPRDPYLFSSITCHMWPSFPGFSRWVAGTFAAARQMLKRPPVAPAMGGSMRRWLGVLWLGGAWICMVTSFLPYRRCPCVSDRFKVRFWYPERIAERFKHYHVKVLHIS